MKNYKVLMIAAFAAVLAVSCCPCRKAKSPQSKSIVNMRWELVDLGGKSVTANNNYFLEFNANEGRFSGKGDCNSISGMYTSPAEGSIKMSGVISTRMFCANQQQETQFLKGLETIDNFKVDGDILMLYSKNDRVATFKAVK